MKKNPPGQRGAQSGISTSTNTLSTKKKPPKAHRKTPEIPAEELFERLNRLYPEAGTALHYTTPFELLVAVVLSAQCTDARVNLVTPALFARFPSPAEMAKASPDDIEPFIRSCGLFRNKAKNLAALSREIAASFGGIVPQRRSELVKLPGVGVKTAGVVSMHLSGEPAFPVDTHVQRLAVRLGLSRESTPEKTEKILEKLFAPERWIRMHHLLIWHGRNTCSAIRPDCPNCGIRDLCPKIGVAPKSTAKGS